MKVKAALVILILSSLIPNLVLVKEELRKYGNPCFRDEATSYEAKFAELKHFLPENGVVGYITDQQPDAGRQEYYLAAYALAPAVVLRGTNYPFVVGNFHRPVTDEAGANPGLVLVGGSCNGVLLFRNEKVK